MGSEISIVNEGMESEDEEPTFMGMTLEEYQAQKRRWRLGQGPFHPEAYTEEPMNLSNPTQQPPEFWYQYDTDSTTGQEEGANTYQLSSTNKAYQEFMRWRHSRGRPEHKAHPEEQMNQPPTRDQSPTIDTTISPEENQPYDYLPDLVSDTPDLTSEDSSDEEQESINIYDISPTRCCSSGARRFILHADTEFPLSEENPVEPRLIVRNSLGVQSEENTSKWLQQPTEWRVRRKTIWLWVGRQDNKNIKEIEESGGSIWLYLKRTLTDEISSKWRITVDMCRRQKQPIEDCLYCCRQTLNFLYVGFVTKGKVSSPACQTSYNHEPVETEDEG